MKASSLKELSGKEKAAIMMLSVGSASAGKIFDTLDTRGTKTIINTIASLGAVDAQLVQAVCAQFLKESEGIVGSVRTIERVLQRTIGRERTQAVVDELKTTNADSMWEKISNLDCAVLTDYLRKERPQMIAVVLSKVSPKAAALVLSRLPREVSSEAISRMLKMRHVQNNIIADVEKTLCAELLDIEAKQGRKSVHTAIAEIFSYMDKNEGQIFLDYLEGNDGEDAARIRALILTFDDLQKIRPSDFVMLLPLIENTQLACALKGASQSVKESLLSNLATRARQQIEEEMEMLGPVRIRDINQAQSNIMEVVKQLIQEGRIQLLELNDEVIS